MTRVTSAAKCGTCLLFMCALGEQNGIIYTSDTSCLDDVLAYQFKHRSMHTSCVDIMPSGISVCTIFGDWLQSWEFL